MHSFAKAIKANDGAPDDLNRDYVLSDGSTDRVGDIIEPAAWKLANFKKNPMALFGHSHSAIIGRWENVRVEGKRLVGRLVLATAGTSELVDYVRQLVAQNLLKAVSVGFAPLEHEPIDPTKPWDGYRFTKVDLLECSLVAVPANANALELSKSFEAAIGRPVPALLSSLMAETGQPEPTRALTPGKTAALSASNLKGGRKMPTITERLGGAEQHLVSLIDLRTALSKKIGEGTDLDGAEQAEWDGIDGAITEAEANVANLKRAQKNLSVQAVSIRQPTEPTVPARPAHIPNRQNNARPSDLLIRMAAASLISHVERQPLSVVLNTMWEGNRDLELFAKAAVTPARTDVAGWAAELVESVVADFLDELTGVSVFADLAARGRKHNFGSAGSIRVPSRNTGAYPDLRGAFVGQGAPIPVRRTTFGAITLTPKKMAVISEFTRELARASDIESQLRAGIIDDTAVAIDTALLDAVAGTIIRPAGLLNGVTPIAPSALGGLAAMQADLAALKAPFISRNAANGLVYLVNDGDLESIAGISWPAGGFVYDVTGGVVGRTPYIASTHVPLHTLILVRASDFSSAAGAVEFDVSDTATIHEEDASTTGAYPIDQTTGVTNPPLPIVDAAGVVAKPVRSMFQTASIALRMMQDMDWAMVRNGMVSVIHNVNWAPLPVV